MAQQELSTVITIRGNVDSSFSQISQTLDQMGTTLTNIGSRVDQISQKLIGTGKESLDLYADFESAMLYIKGLGGLTAEQLGEVEAAARDAGATTRYTALDAANALELGAVAGLHYKDNIALMYETLNMAAAGNMGLADASNQLLSALVITGTAAWDADTYINKMVKTAARSKSDVEGLGDAVIRLGATSNYLSGGVTEMFTLMGKLGDVGLESSEIGTHLRNVILALVAPTNKAADIMETLGTSTEELGEIMDGLNAEEMQQALDQLGLKIYDQDTGKLRNMFEIFTDLDGLLGKMSDEERNGIMSKLFSRRTLASAEALLKVAREGDWQNLWGEIDNSEGFATGVAETRVSGLEGSMLILKSQWQEFELSIGKTLAANLAGTLLYISHPEQNETVEAWKSYLAAQYAAGTPVEVLYELATPIAEPIDPVILRALPGVNTVYADADEITVRQMAGDVLRSDLDKLGKTKQNQLTTVDVTLKASGWSTYSASGSDDAWQQTVSITGWLARDNFFATPTPGGKYQWQRANISALDTTQDGKIMLVCEDKPDADVIVRLMLAEVNV